MPQKYWMVAGVAVAATLVLTSCSSSGSPAKSSTAAAPGGSGGSTSAPAATGNWATAQSAQAGGGMTALVAAAKKEGALNVIALPPTWANYASIISTFQKKYGIHVNSENPNGASADEITAIKATKGQSSAPDVVDVGNVFAVSGAQDGYYAPYKVATWNDIPTTEKDSGGLWYSDYGGYISIGCEAKKVGGTCPTTIKALNNPAYKGKVALNGDPTLANAAFNGVWAAALANGGSISNIQPGIDYFKKLNAAGIFNKTKVTPSTVASGATPIVLDWDYLNVGTAATLKKSGRTWTVTDPSDALVSGFYAQAISINAAHPAAARLWEEYLYSQAPDGGQNGWLRGFARPIELPAMQKAGTADKTALALLPKVPSAPPFTPTQAQITTAKNLVTKDWSAAVS